MIRRRNIMVTGSSGTVGTALVKQLMADGHRVIPVDIRPCLWDCQIDRRTKRWDLRKPLRAANIGQQPDMIIHLAANARVHDLVVKPQLALDNYLMVHHILEYVRQRGVKQVLFSSSREVYGESKPNVKRRELDTHVSKIKAPYTASKFAAEALIHAYAECYDIKPVVARLSNVYGRYDVSERVVPVFLYYALRNMPINVFGREKKLDFTYIDDCVDGLVRIVDRFDRVAGMTFNLSRGKGERLLDLARMIVMHLGSKSEICVGDKRVGEISSFVGDLTLARKYLGYRPTMTLKESIGPSAEWYRQAMRDRRAYESQRRNLKRRGWL
ncbi:MAG: NAD-dependent epimerase/dehydratase family protein [bacterium]